MRRCINASTDRKEKKTICNRLFFVLIAATLLSVAPAKAADEEIPILRYKVAAFAFKSDSTIEATEDGWSHWDDAKAFVILDINEDILKIVANGGKKEFYIYDGEFVDETLVMKAVDDDGDDVTIRKIKQPKINLTKMLNGGKKKKSQTCRNGKGLCQGFRVSEVRKIILQGE